LKKRKAQNRAAQRAFRERKEKHLKDLEDKVEELEKASAATNNENELLRAQVERITSELNEYKKKSALMPNTRQPPVRKGPTGFGSAGINNLNDVNFQFEFPKFGVLPGPPTQPAQGLSPSTTTSPRQGSESNPVSPSGQGKESSRSPISMNAGSANNVKDTLTAFSAFFTPPLSGELNLSRTSLDSTHFSLGAAATSSPSASSNSNMGASSSCGTSPEPFTQSPMGFKPVDTLTTIGEEQSTILSGGQGMC
jgi:AP-1-like transcription factor